MTGHTITGGTGSSPTPVNIAPVRAIDGTGSGGAGSACDASSGGLFDMNLCDGASGMVAFRYLGPPQYTYGTVVQLNGYTYHYLSAALATTITF